MEAQNSSMSFKNQDLFIGLDVHKKNWLVTIRCGKIVLKTFSMDPIAQKLGEYMTRNYPEGNYYSVYEAGFCGYRVHRDLEKAGIRNIIAAPTEIPTSISEKTNKTDPVDSRKLARELENRTLKGIYIPEKLQEEIRSLVRLRFQLVKTQTRLKNQIKGYLNFYGHELPKNFEMRHWSARFIEVLRNMEFEYPIGKQHLKILLDELTDKRKKLCEVQKSIKEFLCEYNLNEKVIHLCTVPGIGYTTAATLYTEIMDPNRFKDFDKLASYCGLVPAIRSSGDKQTVLGIKFRHNLRIRQLLVEAAWMAIRKDPALTLAYTNYIKRMSKQEAIIRIAKKLLSRIRYVWTTGNKYSNAVIK